MLDWKEAIDIQGRSHRAKTLKTGRPTFNLRTWKKAYVAPEQMELGKEWCEMKLEKSEHADYACYLNAGN